MKSNVAVLEVMSQNPICVHVHQSVAEAGKVMQEGRFRHLPVLQGNHLVGVLSERDVACIGGIKHLDPARVMVSEAMQSEPYVCAPETPLVEVAATMLERRVEAAIVEKAGKVVGIFTQVDALRVLVAASER
jgi:acetoin utilization protein AcuB